jgi:hypothetical protein
VADRVLDKVVELLSSSRRGNSTDFAEVTVTLSIVRHNSNIPIYKKYWPMFPDSSREIELTTDGETIKRKFNHKYHEFALGEWVTKYGVKEGDIIRITPILKKEKYRVNFIKKS